MRSENNIVKDEIDVISLLSILLDNFNLLLSVFLSSLLIIAVFFFSATKLYQSNSLIEVKGENSNLLPPSLSVGTSSFNPQDSLKAEIEIYKSNDTILDALKKLEEIPEINFEDVPSVGQVRSNLSLVSNDKFLINISYTSSNKFLSKTLLNLLNQEYTEDRKNFIKQSSSAGKIFVQNEIPRIKQLLKTAEDNLNTFKVSTNTSDVIFESPMRITKLEELKSRLNEITFKELELKEFYKETHPIYLTLKEQKNLITSQINEIEEDLPNIPSTQRTLENFKREVQIYSNVLGELSSQELALSMAEASSMSNVRIINYASNAAKVYPQTIIFAFSIFIFTLTYIFLSIQHFLGNKITNFDALMDYVGKDKIIGELPLIPKSEKDTVSYYSSIADELLNKTIYDITNADIPGNSYSVVSSRKGAGKTEISRSIFDKLRKKHRTCLIDLDYRKKGLTKEFNISKPIKSIQEFKEQREDFLQDENSLFVPSFEIENTPDFFTSAEFKNFINELKEEFDYVICDTPPWRLFVDAKIISELIDVHIYVVCNQSSSFNDIDAFINDLGEDKEFSFFYNKFKIYFNFLWYKYQYPYYSRNYYYDYVDYSGMQKSFTLTAFSVKFSKNLINFLKKWINLIKDVFKRG